MLLVSDSNPAYGTCSGGILVPLCGEDEPCPDGHVCEMSVCQKLCKEDMDCGPLSTCGTNSICAPKCTVFAKLYGRLVCVKSCFRIRGQLSPALTNVL